MHFDTYSKQTLLEANNDAIARLNASAEFIGQLPPDLLYLGVDGSPRRGGFREVRVSSESQPLELLLAAFPPLPVRQQPEVPANLFACTLAGTGVEQSPDLLPFWQSASSIADTSAFTWFSQVGQGPVFVVSVLTVCDHSIPDGFQAIRTRGGDVVYRRP